MISRENVWSAFIRRNEKFFIAIEDKHGHMHVTHLTELLLVFYKLELI